MAFETSCQVCGTNYVAQRRTSKYCSKKCNVRAARGAPSVPTTADKPNAPPAPEYDTLAEQIRESLTELQALNTISGVAALRVAQQIDRGRDTGSAVATLTKELSRLVTAAVAESAPKRRDAADEIAATVIQKLQRLNDPQNGTAQ